MPLCHYSRRRISLAYWIGSCSCGGCGQRAALSIKSTATWSIEAMLRTNRGEPAIGAKDRAATLYSVGPTSDQTMKQPSASAARLRGGGPILWTAWRPCDYSGHRHLGSSSTAQIAGVESPVVLFSCSADQVGCRSTTPCGTSPVVTMRQSAMSSLRARATIIVVLRAPLTPSVLARNHCASTLSL